MKKKMVLKIVFFSIAFLKVFWKDFGEVLGGFGGVFWSSFSLLGDTFSNSHEHFESFYRFGMKNCSDLLAVVGWRRSRGILASILGVLGLKKYEIWGYF